MTFLCVPAVLGSYFVMTGVPAPTSTSVQSTMEAVTRSATTFPVATPAPAGCTSSSKLIIALADPSISPHPGPTSIHPSFQYIPGPTPDHPPTNPSIHPGFQYLIPGPTMDHPPTNPSIHHLLDPIPGHSIPPVFLHLYHPSINPIFLHLNPSIQVPNPGPSINLMAGITPSPSILNYV